MTQCEARHKMTAARCELPEGHTENHRGAFQNGSVQWPEPIAASLPVEEAPQGPTEQQADDVDMVNAITAIVREADRGFQKSGGSSRHWVRDCFLPLINERGWQIRPSPVTGEDAPPDEFIDTGGDSVVRVNPEAERSLAAYVAGKDAPPAPPQQADHELKAWPEYFAALLSGEKTFELRFDDRGFKVGDLLRLREFDLASEAYSGRELRRRVTYIVGGGQFGLVPHNVCMSLAPAPPQDDPRIAAIRDVNDKCLFHGLTAAGACHKTQDLEQWCVNCRIAYLLDALTARPQEPTA